MVRHASSGRAKINILPAYYLALLSLASAQLAYERSNKVNIIS
jgi:hypothetical protein